MKQTLKAINQSVLFFDLFLLLLIFILSLCLANYLGLTVNTPGFILGWFSAAFILLSLKIMDFYTLPESQLDDDHRYILRIFPGINPSSKTGYQVNPQYRGLTLLLIMLGGWAVLQFVMLQMKILPMRALWLLGLMILITLIAGLPSLNFIRNGYRELIQVLLLFGIFPAYAFLVLNGNFHILIFLLSFPMSFFYLSWRIVHALFHYSDDQQSGKRNLLQRLGWKRGMVAHNMFILLGFVLYTCIPIAGYPSKLFLSALLAFPLGLLLIFMMFRIERGKKPEWQSVMALEKISILFMVYFIAAAMILR